MHPPDDITERFAAAALATAELAPDASFLQRLDRALASRQPSTLDAAIVYLEHRAPLIAASASLCALPLCAYGLLIWLKLPETVWDLLMDVMV